MTSTREPVLLVGGGPGDPALLTLRAEAALAAAATVLVDGALAPLAAEVAPQADLVTVDGRSADAVVDLVRGARLPVVRLYLGDPWLHPAHEAERAALAAAGLPTEPVPGVSVAIGTATAAGRPAHHRGVSVAAIVRGHELEVVRGG